MKRFLKKFSEITAKDVNSAGGKGANLGEMYRHAIPVPNGFVVLTSCFDHFIRIAAVDQRVSSLLESLDGNDLDTITSISAEVTGWIEGGTVPEEMKSDIMTHFDQLSAPLVAVRSSANAEDRADSAWAGQLETYLGTTRDNLIPNIRKCWASLFTPRALAYRFQNDLMTASISVAVVIQEMVASEVAGVAFSVHPVSQDTDQMIIEAGFGLGESVVSGAITPDSYIIRKSNREILEVNASEQIKGFFLNQQGGADWKDIPANQFTKNKLSKDEILELADIVIRIESYFQFPCDIEWARKGNAWYILQCRPITTLDS